MSFNHTFLNKTETHTSETTTGLHEECGICGVIVPEAMGNNKAWRDVHYALHSLQHRGQEAAGIATYDAEKAEMNLHAGLGLLSQVMKHLDVERGLPGQVGIGHVRYASTANNLLQNVQPFVFNFHDMDLAFAHNGNLTNSQILRKELEDEGAVFHSTSDAEVLVHLLRRSPGENFRDKLCQALRKLKGCFNFVLLKDGELYACVDPNQFRPLAIGALPEGGYVVASETCALDTLGARFIEEIRAGEVVHFTPTGYQKESYTQETRSSILAMEYIYFARPDSKIAGVNVHTARKRSGQILAQEAPAENADIVVGVPNSSLSAASGYAEAARIPYEMGLIKSNYVARTFIQPNQAKREEAVNLKLSAVRGVVAGKKVVLVDDSLVRGTTARRIVRHLKDAGALEVHVRIASPVFRFPSFYGIDVTHSSELLGAQQTVAEMQETIGADSLAFLSVPGLVKAIDLDEEGPYQGLCLESFTGDYPVPILDYEEQFEAELTPLQADYLKAKAKQEKEQVDDE